MKTITLVFALILVSVQSFSQAVRDKAFYEQKVIRFTKMKNTGTVLAITGGVLAVVGLVVLSNAPTETTEDIYGNTQTAKTGPKAVVGGVCLISGVFSAGAGIPLAIIGSKNKEKYESKAKSLSFRFNANPKNTGLVLTYKF